jgi:hypothetical protein
MLDKVTKEEVQALDKDLGLGIQLATTIGGQRSLTLTAGVPLDWGAPELDRLLDKLVAASDRQKRIFDLEQTRQLLKNEEQNYHLHTQQLANQEITFAAQFTDGGRHGEWKPNGAQRSVIEGLKKNIVTSADRIKQLRENIVKGENECR